MIRRFWNPAGWHKSMRGCTRRGLRILGTLALAFLFVGINSASVAQADPVSANVRFIMVARPSADYVCVNQSMTLRLYVYRVFDSQPGAEPRLERLSGVVVDATAQSIGTITPNRQMTGFNSYDPEGAEFTFRAGKKPGTAKILFEGLINVFWAAPLTFEEAAKPIYVDEPVEVQVRNCGYKVSVFFVETFPGVMMWTGFSDEIKLNADSDTHFSGSAGFKYAQRLLIQMPKCPYAITVVPTKIDYQADQIEDTLHLTFLVQNATTQITNACVSIGGYGIGEMSERLVNVYLPSAGGAITYPEPPYGVFKIFVRRVVE